MDTDGFIIQIKTEDFFKDIADDVVKWFDTSNYSEDDKRQLPRGMNKIGRNWSNFVIGPFKDELGGKIMAEFVALRPKTYSYLIDDGNEHQRAEGTKICVIKRELKFKNYKDCTFKNEIISKSQRRFKS